MKNMEPIQQTAANQITTTAGPRSLKSTSNQQSQEISPAQKAKLERLCTEFASLFSYTILKSMRSTLPKSSWGGEVQGKELMNSLMDEKMAQYLSAQDGFGIKELLIKKFIMDNPHLIK